MRSPSCPPRRTKPADCRIEPAKHWLAISIADGLAGMAAWLFSHEDLPENVELLSKRHASAPHEHGKRAVRFENDSIEHAQMLDHVIDKAEPDRNTQRGDDVLDDGLRCHVDAPDPLAPLEMRELLILRCRLKVSLLKVRREERCPFIAPARVVSACVGNAWRPGSPYMAKANRFWPIAG